MSFSQSVKEEILKNVKKVKGCCATSFLTAVIKSIGLLSLENNAFRFDVESDNLELLEFCAFLAKNYLDEDGEIVGYRQKNKSVGNNVKYALKFGKEIGKKLGLIDAYGSFAGGGKVSSNLDEPCCRRTFLQALFLSAGSVTVPRSEGDLLTESAHGNYHLEIRFSNADFAEFVKNTFAEIDFKQIARKNCVVLYLKESAKIADFFVTVDAVNAKFTVENIIIGRSFRNTANRQRNCIDSNIEKSVVAGSKQLEAIKYIRSMGMFDALPQQLKDVAVAREQNPDANLAELAAVLNISKSGVNHRLARLVELQEKK
ncbi:MAG: DNA-binding protein WhiA [Corallococcus sp.]|nr:DNA-binding protein WhiA [Corallococcus sp.]MCM1358987.1 DNA-binding protein WhiA [Corallococcus sp.]MCM1394976.1 DNA-binding protein WhiA [Corallococcus sp.]